MSEGLSLHPCGCIHFHLVSLGELVADWHWTKIKRLKQRDSANSYWAEGVFCKLCLQVWLKGEKKTNGVTVGSTIFCLIEERKFVENCQLRNERKKKPQLNVPFYISSAIEILFFIREMSEFWEGLSVATRRIVRGSRVSESLWCPLGNTYYIHLKVRWWFNKNQTVKKPKLIKSLLKGRCSPQIRSGVGWVWGNNAQYKSLKWHLTGFFWKMVNTQPINTTRNFYLLKAVIYCII